MLCSKFSLNDNGGRPSLATLSKIATLAPSHLYPKFLHKPFPPYIIDLCMFSYGKYILLMSHICFHIANDRFVYFLPYVSSKIPVSAYFSFNKYYSGECIA